MVSVHRCSRVLDTFILYNFLPSGGRAKMQERMQRTMDLLVGGSVYSYWVLIRLSSFYIHHFRNKGVLCWVSPD